MKIEQKKNVEREKLMSYYYELQNKIKGFQLLLLYCKVHFKYKFFFRQKWNQIKLKLRSKS